jgi:hypothetical protein
LLPDKKNENLATFEIPPVKNALCSSLLESFSTCYIFTQQHTIKASFLFLEASTTLGAGILITVIYSQDEEEKKNKIERIIKYESLLLTSCTPIYLL